MLNEMQGEILRLKKETGTAILAHSYQSADILEIADLRGDSFALSVQAKKRMERRVLLCGVRFMAQTVKMLCPEKTVILPVAEATCPMAEQIPPERVRRFKAENPSFQVVAYINTTAELKAECDVCVTSSSALKIVAALPGRDILFIPDRNLGGYIKRQLPEKNILLWDGCCPVHDAVTAADALAAKAAHPGAKLLAHPELPAEVLQYADLIGSTADILNAAGEPGEYIIGTENSIAAWLALQNPAVRCYPLSKRLICPDMRLTTLPDVLRAIKGGGGEEIQLEEALRLAAKRPVDEMIRLGQ